MRTPSLQRAATGHMSTLSDELREHMRKLGQKGGKRRLETMTPEERTKAARKAGKASGKARRDKELDNVPACRVCGRIPRNYARFDDGTIQCAADSSINCEETTS